MDRKLLQILISIFFFYLFYFSYKNYINYYYLFRNTKFIFICELQ